MANGAPGSLPDQSFPDSERLFRRVHRDNLRANGKPTIFAFELPDMSVNREQHSSEEGARQGFRPEDWGVVAFFVGDIPARDTWAHLAEVYQLLPRHVPETGNFAHSEVRVRRRIETNFVLVTYRGLPDFHEHDPDRDALRCSPVENLDPDFHQRWRKHIALASKPVLLPQEVAD